MMCGVFSPFVIRFERPDLYLQKINIRANETGKIRSKPFWQYVYLIHVHLSTFLYTLVQFHSTRSMLLRSVEPELIFGKQAIERAVG
jgi:hypothetical protein